MANYVSKHTGAQIDAAVAAYLAGGSPGGSTGSPSLNLWNHAADTLGNLNQQGEVVPGSTDYKVSDFIPFSTGESVYVYCRYTSENRVALASISVGSGAALAMYDADKVFIADAWPTSDADISNPYPITTANVAYIRLRFAAAHLDNADRHYGIFKQAVTLDTFDEYGEGSGTGGSTGTDCSCTSNLNGKNILVIGDSLSAADKWQQQLVAQGASHTNHAKGGIGLLAMVDGDDTLPALSVEDVTGKDGIIIFGGTNNMRTERGCVGDFGEVVVSSRNKWNHAATTVGTFNSDYSDISPDATDYVVTDFIPFTTGESLYVYCRYTSTNSVSLANISVGSGAALVLYDANKNYIADVWPTADVNISNPYTITTANVAYIRLRWASPHFNNTDRHYGIFKEEVTLDTFDEYTESLSAGSTVASYMQHVIRRVYFLLLAADNLDCRVMVVTPFCFGASEYNEDAYAMDGLGLAQVIEDVANYYGIPVYNAYKNSGINPTTLMVWGKSETDNLHLNDAGYAHLGRRIAHFANEHIME